MDPVLKEVKSKYEGKLEVIKVNIEDSENYGIAERYGVRVMPTIIFLNEDRVIVDRYEGILSLKDIEKVLSSMGVK